MVYLQVVKTGFSVNPVVDNVVVATRGRIVIVVVVVRVRIILFWHLDSSAVHSAGAAVAIVVVGSTAAKKKVFELNHRTFFNYADI